MQPQEVSYYLTYVKADMQSHMVITNPTFEKESPAFSKVPFLEGI